MDPFISQIIAVGCNFAPRGWMACEGQLLPIASYTALFSLVGTMYGGDGRTTFALPDLRGRVPIGKGQGPGLSNHNQGDIGGTEQNVLTTAQMPAHTHALNLTAAVNVSTTNPSTDEAANAFLANTSSNFYATSGSAGSNLGGVTAAGTAANAGNNAAVTNMQPYLALIWVIAVEGTYPSRP